MLNQQEIQINCLIGLQQLKEGKFLTKEVILKQGKIILRKPKAGVRNKALMKAETGDGIKQTTFLVELMPYCIIEHPFGTVPIREALDNLEMDEYDKLIEVLTSLCGPTQEDDIKKSEQPSGQTDTPKISDLKT